LTDLTPTPMTAHHSCPMCRLSLNQTGRLIAFRDDAGQHFAFAICQRCSGRLARLPVRVQQQQLNAAVGAIAAHPERYSVRSFDSADAAKLFAVLEAERLSGKQP
jgi:hypothetical protein